MLLNEIFDTRNKVEWLPTNKGFIGKFIIDDDEYFLDIDEYEIKFPKYIKNVFDVGFRKGLSSKITGDFKAARVLGSVLNGLKQKVNEHKPDIITFGMLDKNGAVEERKIIYSRLASLISKTTEYDHLSDWYKFEGGTYAFMANFNLTKEDELAIDDLIANSVK